MISKVLVVDDDDVNRKVLENMLQDKGYRVIQAENGREAVDMFDHELPDLVLMDIIMPEMDGYEATRQIRVLAGDRFVPVIFLTVVTDEEQLAQCVTAGGNDFLTKPFSQIILMSKIEAMEQMRELYNTVKCQRDEIEQHHLHLQREHKVARRLFSRQMHTGCLDRSNIRYLISSLSVFNGDMLLAAQTPSGGLNVMLGDATGHGLPAAIGALPVADIFYGMSANGYSLSEIITELNQKLKDILPTEFFLCACLINLASDNRTLSLWNGGLPDVIIYSVEKQSVSAHFASSDFALGMFDNDQLQGDVQMIELAEGDRIFIYSDGITEASNTNGEMFGEARFMGCFENNSEPEHLFDEIQETVKAFRGGQGQSDDMTLLEVIAAPGTTEFSVNEHTQSNQGKPAMDWLLSFSFGPDELRTMNPVPLLTQLLMEIQGLKADRENIFIILSELFNNALDHGVLDLDSRLKISPESFTDYYALRQQRLEKLEQGYINIKLNHGKTDSGGQLTICIEDSGSGFNSNATLSSSESKMENASYCGRGILRVQSLCEQLSYHEPGNCVEATYFW